MRTKFYDWLLEGNDEASIITKWQESAHCVALGIFMMKGSVSDSDLQDKKLLTSAYSKYCEVDASLDDIYNLLTTKPVWLASIVRAANKIGDYLKGKNYKFYRTFGIMDEISNLYKRLRPSKVNTNKWNPSDIWCSKVRSLPTTIKIIR
jgi:hypothetical protein